MSSLWLGDSDVNTDARQDHLGMLQYRKKLKQEKCELHHVRLGCNKLRYRRQFIVWKYNAFQGAFIEKLTRFSKLFVRSQSAALLTECCLWSAHVLPADSHGVPQSHTETCIWRVLKTAYKERVSSLVPRGRVAVAISHPGSHLSYSSLRRWVQCPPTIYPLNPTSVLKSDYQSTATS
jgi:hypothetical protein